ncbi:hypothetical protein J0H58_36235 [bacterium]|nr:hypothetical protein [bacterium]
MSWDSIESSRLRASVVGEWEPVLIGPTLRHLQRPHRAARARLILRDDGTADDGVPVHPSAPFPRTWQLSDGWVLTIATPVPPMPEYDQPDWVRDTEDFRVLEASGDTLAWTRGDLFTVFRRVRDEEYERWWAAGAGTGTEASESAPDPRRRGTRRK